MEMNEPDILNLPQPNSGENSQDGSNLIKDNEIVTDSRINDAERLLDDLIKTVCDDSTLTINTTVAQRDNSDETSKPICNTKESTTKESTGSEVRNSLFHLSDSMKKGLSMLTFPSKTHSRKKGITSPRPTSSLRITIGEALEKAQDVRKSMSDIQLKLDIVESKERLSLNSIGHHVSSDKGMAKGKSASQDVGVGLLTHSDTGSRVAGEGKKKIRNTSALAGLSITAGSSHSDQPVKESAADQEGKRVSVAGKTKSPGTSRIQMTPRMWELLKFTFIHEHFPSSVHMARLGKMMGLPWSQIRNWFTDRRVDNKKAGIFPRDRTLIDCPYCDITLKTEAEQKGHLFSTQHVKKILGPEYAGGDGGGGSALDPIRWKKLPKTVNAVSKVSGARILAVGYTAEDVKPSPADPAKSEQGDVKTMETVGGEAAHSKDLQKLWTEAMLLKGEKEQVPAEWNVRGVNQDKSLDSQCETIVQGKKENVLLLKMKDAEEKVLKQRCKDRNPYSGKMVVNSGRVASIPLSASDVPASVNNSFPVVSVNNNNLPVAVNAVTPMTASNIITVSSYDALPWSASAVPTSFPGDPCSSKCQQFQDMPSVPQQDAPRTTKVQGKKRKKTCDMSRESPVESRHLPALGTETPNRIFKVAVAGNLKRKNKHKDFAMTHVNNVKTEMKPGKSGDKVNSLSLIPTHYLQEFEPKQEAASSEAWSKNNITLYRADNGDEQGKCEMTVLNTNKQSSTVNQNKGFCVPSTAVSVQLQKAGSSATEPPVSKAGIRSVANKISKHTLDKRKSKLQIQQVGSTMKTNRQVRAAQDENIIVGYQCPNCSKVYQTEWLMVKHSITHFRYHCDICYQVYPTENMMKLHLLDHLTRAYEDEKYYCQFSCKTCHSLKCGCYEPTYCKPKELPRVFLRPQKAKRSKKTFTTKLNSGPNDHLRINLATYRKLVNSGSLSNANRGKLETSIPLKPAVNSSETKKCSLSEDSLKSDVSGDAQKPPILFKGMHIPDAALGETKKSCSLQRENHEYVDVTGETDCVPSANEACPRKVSTAAVQQMAEAKSNDETAEEPDLSIEKEKHLSGNEMKANITENYQVDTIPIPETSGLPNIEDSKGGITAKRHGSRRRTTKLSSNFIYEDTDFYYLCEICDASFLSKPELSEHMFFHRLKSRSRRGDKRSFSSVAEEKEVPKKIKVNDPEEKGDAETVLVGGFMRYKCDLCAGHFASITDLNRHRTQAHKEPGDELSAIVNASAQYIDVYQCNYCEKVYRREREFKRHLKRDCVSAPKSLRGKLSGLSSLKSLENGSHYTVVKINLEESAMGVSTSKSAAKANAKGPIVCKYCSAVTKREAEMKRHIWKFCLKVPSEVVKRFMAGTSLEELGFQYIKGKEESPDTSKESFEDVHAEILGKQGPKKPFLIAEKNMDPSLAVQSRLSEEESLHMSKPSVVQPQLSEELPTLQSQPFEELSCELQLSEEPTILQTQQSKETSALQQLSEESSIVQARLSGEPSSVQPQLAEGPSTLQPQLSGEPSTVQPQLSGEPSTIQPQPPEESILAKCSSEELANIQELFAVKPEPFGKTSPTKHSTETKNAESPAAAVDEATQSSPSSSPLASPVMKFPIVLPVVSASAKSKRPLVCAYCGIWYFREMAILKHMKERCIKIPKYEKELLANGATLCNVPQNKAEAGGTAADTLAIYKMVQVPEHMQKTQVPMPKGVSNEDIKELSTNIKAYSERVPTLSPATSEPETTSSISPPVLQNRSVPKKGSRCRRCHEHFNSHEAVLAHSSVHHGPKKGLYKCKLCQARLPKYKQLREHVWEHTNENPYRCHLCEVKYRSSDALVEHLQTLHQYYAINDKNLFKWLPCRNGKYREIKTSKNCEEKLDNSDANLDSLAEVMVITDKDICTSKSNSKISKGMEHDAKYTCGSSEHEGLDSNQIVKADDGQQKLDSETSIKTTQPVDHTLLSGNINLKPELLKSPDENVTPSTEDKSVDSHRVKGCERIDKDKLVNAEGAVVAIDQSKDKISSDSNSVELVTEKGKDEGIDMLKSKTTEDVECVSRVTGEAAESVLDDSLTESGEGLLPLVGNLDSVIETIQLTDKHLS